MNDDAHFVDNVDKVCSKVSQKAGWVLRTFACRQTHFMKLMLKQLLLQGHIDYASPLYQPLQSSNRKRIEKLQKNFTRRIPQVKEQNYWQRRTSLKMLSQLGR